MFDGRIFNSAPPGKRANSDVPFVEPFTNVDVITGVVKLVDAPLTSNLCKCAPFVPFGNVECCGFWTGLRPLMAIVFVCLK